MEIQKNLIESVKIAVVLNNVLMFCTISHKTQRYKFHLFTNSEIIV